MPVRTNIFLILLLCHAALFGQVKVIFITGKLPPFKTGAQKIYIAGDFNRWNPASAVWQLRANGTGSYQVIIDMPKGDYSFKLTKGSWETVECGTGGQDVANRSITVLNDTTITMDVKGWKDDFTAVPKKHTASPSVHLISEKFDMPQLGRQRRIWIYLPPAYNTSNKKYPVIYMQDGQNLFDEYTAGYGEWGIDEFMDKMEDSRQSIIVGVDHGGEDRITEYDPTDSKYGKGRGNDYVDFLTNTLKPYIDGHYRTRKDARHTTVAGSSMGGLISMYAVLKYPHIFGNGGIFSPAFWISPEIFDIARQQKLPANNRFYFVCGDMEDKTMVDDMQKMADVIQAKGIAENNTPTVIMQGARHNEAQWNKDFPAFYSWLLRGY